MATHRKYGGQCPAYDCWKVKGDEGYTCKYCDGCVSMDDGGVECSYSPKPTTIPKYKKGDVLYKCFHHECYEQSEVREVKYDGKFQWLYTFERERYPYKEREVFKTEKEVEEYLLKKHFYSLYEEMVKYKEKYKVLPSIDAKLLNDKNI